MKGLPFYREERFGVGLVVVAVTTFWMLAHRPEWVGSWGETVAALETSTILTYPLIAAFAAWISSRPRRHHFLSLIQAGSRSKLAAWVLANAQLCGCAAAGFLLATVLPL